MRPLVYLLIGGYILLMAILSDTSHIPHDVLTDEEMEFLVRHMERGQ